ncbi:MAG TPA: DsrE family protein [Chitinophagaceae bacterium]
MFKRIFIATIILLFVASANAQHKVIMQIASNDTLAWKGLMNNIKNLKAAWGDSVQIEVVAHSFGLDLLMTARTNQLEKIAQYKKMGVDFRACESAMAERKIPKEAMIAEAGYVKMAVKEIVLRQEEGWSYFKAGF